jgi:hypothetical protein
VLNWAPFHKYVWRSGDITLPFLTSELNRGEWSASSHSHFHPREKSPRYPLDRRLGGHQSRSGGCGDDKNHLNLPGIEQSVAIPTELSRFTCSCVYTYLLKMHLMDGDTKPKTVASISRNYFLWEWNLGLLLWFLNIWRECIFSFSLSLSLSFLCLLYSGFLCERILIAVYCRQKKHTFFWVWVSRHESNKDVYWKQREFRATVLLGGKTRVTSTCWLVRKSASSSQRTVVLVV